MAADDAEHPERAPVSSNCVIVIPFVTVNSYLLECLDGCLALDYDNFRIALLPDASIQLPAKYQRDNIDIIVTGNCTIAAKRNIAFKYFPDAKYFALIDSDAYPDAHWLANSVSFLNEHPEVWSVGGPNITPLSEPLLQRAVGNALRTFVVSGPLYFAKNISSASRFCSSLHSCNLVLNRNVYDRIGGFDETLFTGEDRNLCDRICAAGKKIYFHSSVIVYHHNRSLWLPFFQQRLTYGYCSMAIGKRQFNRNNLMLLLPLAWLLLFILIMLYETLFSSSLTVTIWFATLNVVAALILAARTTRIKCELPHTVAAILVSYIGMTIGQLFAIAGIQLDLKKIYSNRPPATHSTGDTPTVL